jgi:hypothetical protein
VDDVSLEVRENDPLCRDGTLRLTQDQLTHYADFSVDSVAVHKPPEPRSTHEPQ